MKKITRIAAFICFCLICSAFSPIDTAKVDYTDITSQRTHANLTEVGSFQEAEESATTSDKGTWAKRYRIWTDFTKSSKLNAIEQILNKN